MSLFVPSSSDSSRSYDSGEDCPPALYLYGGAVCPTPFMPPAPVRHLYEAWLSCKDAVFDAMADDDETSLMAWLERATLATAQGAQTEDEFLTRMRAFEATLPAAERTPEADVLRRAMQ